MEMERERKSVARRRKSMYQGPEVQERFNTARSDSNYIARARDKVA